MLGNRKGSNGNSDRGHTHWEAPRSPRQLAMPYPKGTLMPGRRNYAAELAQLAAPASDRQRALYRMMREQLPEYELALTGWDRVLAFLHGLGIRRPNGHILTRRIVQRWVRTDGFPLVRG